MNSFKQSVEKVAFAIWTFEKSGQSKKKKVFKGKIQFCLIFHIKKFDRYETLLLQLRNESINLHGGAC